MADYKTLALAAGLGIAAGMRSMAAPALLSHYLSRWTVRGRDRTLRVLASPRTANTLKLCAAGEMVADKTPYIPNRTDPPALVGRIFSGALSGAVVAGWRGGSQPAGALTGAVAAGGATFLAYELRKWAAERSTFPDPVLGLIEDVIVLAAGSRVAAEAVNTQP